MKNTTSQNSSQNKTADRVNLKDLTLSGLEHLMEELALEKYRAGQIARWVFQRGATSFLEMTNLSRELRERLDVTTALSRPVIRKKQVSGRGDTVKYLFELADGQLVETVLMRQDYGNTACLSTQVGCRMGCRFCASGLSGLVRNLTPGEIYDQVIGLQADSGARVSHIVIMGSGEPLDNYQSTMTFIKNVTATYGLNISARHITLSTCGLVPGIKELSKEKLPLTLAVSLHAPDNALRDTLVPINKKYPLEVLIPACRDYARETGRRITFEYALLKGVNDSRGHALELSRLLSGLLCHVNLIPANPVEEGNVVPPPREQVELFRLTLEKQGIPATVRRERGADIEAACGQLRRREMGRGID